MAATVCPSCGRSTAGAGHLAGLCPACLLQTALTHAPVPHRIVGPLGLGPRGPIALAERTDGSHRLLTIKEVSVPISSPGSLERIDATLRRLTKLNHPVLLPFLDGAVTESGRLRLVADYVPGSAVRVFVRREHPPMPVRAGILADVCRAVAFAHANGFTHGRLNPCDVLVSAYGGTAHTRLRDVGLPELMGLDPEPGRDLLGLADIVDAVAAGAEPMPPPVAEALRALRSGGAGTALADTAVAADAAATALDRIAGSGQN